LPANPAAEIMDIAARSRDEKYGDPSLWDYWWPRLARIADWLASHEKAWRQTHTPIGYEIKGKTTIKTKSGDFTLTARADRIDKGPDGKAAIIDYKSGGTYSPGKLKKGELPQLPLESIILRKGGFTDIQAMESAELA